MVLNIVGTVVAGFVLLYIVATLIRLAGFGSLATLLGQIAVNGVVGYALLSISFISLPVVVGLVLMPVAIRLFAYGWFYWQSKKTLNGDYGEQAKWAAELVEGGDDEFAQAAVHLSRVELREIGVIAESKEELREIAIERGQEMDDSTNR